MAKFTMTSDQIQVPSLSTESSSAIEFLDAGGRGRVALDPAGSTSERSRLQPDGEARSLLPQKS